MWGKKLKVRRIYLLVCNIVHHSQLEIIEIIARLRKRNYLLKLQKLTIAEEKENFKYR